MEIPRNLAYLFLNIGFGILWVVFFVCYPQSRKMQLKLSLLAAPLGPIIECLYFRDYWYPLSILEIHWGGFRILPEDLAFSFLYTGVTGVLAHITGKKVDDLQMKSPMQLVGVGLISIFLAIPILLLGLNSIFATSISFLLIAGFTSAKKKDSWKYGLFCGGATMAMTLTIYVISYYSVSNIEEILKSAWFLYSHPVWGTRMFNIPVTELFWSFSWGTMMGAVRNYLFC